MWRRAYLFLVLVRLYFALSPSYLHPDENFQGPEIIAGRVFSYQVHLTWEFTAVQPIRSSFPLWLVYGLPMFVLRAIWEGFGHDEITPVMVYWALRALMFILSFVLEDWALWELVQSPRYRRSAVLLTASCYVTWTFQTHTFSNSVETLAVLWSLVLAGRIVEDKHSGLFASALLAFVFVLGTFNRITFLAFVIIPALRLLPHFRRKPLSLLVIVSVATCTAFSAVVLDTIFYSSEALTLDKLFKHPIITPINNLLYNASVDNLSEHGLHPYYQHLIVNLPQLLGPAFPLAFLTYRKTIRLACAVTGIVALSLFPHQEPRFLLPTVPLILSSLRIPRNYFRLWVATWVIFNVFMGLLLGIFHQGGVIPMQAHIASWQEPHAVLWWKTYSPPRWLLDGSSESIRTIDLMGMPADSVIKNITGTIRCPEDGSFPKELGKPESVILVAPRSAVFLDRFVLPEAEAQVTLEELWHYSNHINLDDVDFGDDGVWPTLKRVVGRRGLVLWKAQKKCEK
ncbi:Alg9-like mannosyltransferase [Lineolata rhizophorae]|uniref:Mannosyltransferase n=1 Tax=Lineolata rhizophorae TaxID=578093 RepID=A0A6A6P0B1_9PEZI|nr:Alg9-like mannosyltransferase [Lineolata rhizophorae]